MVEYTIIGIEHISYVNKNGRQVNGYRLHLTYEKKGCDGLAVEPVFVGQELGEGLETGQIINLMYNRFGNIVQVSVLC